jgi:hypothetical protein
MPFGIPTFEEATSLMEGVVGDNINDFTNIASQIMTAVGTPAVENRSDIGRVQGHMRSLLGRATKAGEQNLDSVGSTVDIQLGNAISQSLHDLPPGPADATGVLHTSGAPGNATPVSPGGFSMPPLTKGANVPSIPVGMGPAGTPAGAGAPPTAPPVAAPPAAPPIGGQQPEIGQSLGFYCNGQQVAEFLQLVGFPGIVWFLNPDTNNLAGTFPLAQLVAQGWHGPYQDEATAKAACNPNQPLPPPAAPPPPDVAPPPEVAPPVNPGPANIPPEQAFLPPQPPTNNIPDPPTVAPPSCVQQMPIVGSQDFCDNMAQIRNTLISVGNEIIAFMDKWIDPTQVLGPWGSPPNYDDYSGSTSVFQWWADTLLFNVKNFGRQILYYIKAAWKWLKSEACKWMPCDPAAILALNVVQMALKLLKKTRLGTDAGAWLTADFEFAMEAAERIVEYFTNTICPITIPGISDAINCYLNGTAELPLAKCWVALQGGDWDVWFHVTQARRTRPTVNDVIEYSRRLGLDDTQLPKYLRNYGYLFDEEIQATINLFDRVPTEQQTYSWIRNQLIDDKFVNDYGLNQGFEENYWPKFGDILRSNGITKQVSAFNYAGHWQIPDNPRLLEMAFRLRPDKPGVKAPFSLDDYLRFTTGFLTPPFFRDRLEAIARPLPGEGQLRSWYNNLVIDDNQLVSYYQDYGYSLDHANNFLAEYKIIRARSRASSGHGWTPSAMAKAYAANLITPQQIFAEMQDLGYTQDESQRLMTRAKTDLQYTVFMRARSRAIFQMATTVKTSITAGTMSVNDGIAALEGIGFPVEYATTMAQMADVAARANLAKVGVNRIRAAFRQGEVDAADAKNRLIQLGVIDGRADQLIVLWTIENTPNRKRRTASQIVSDVSAGHMTIEEALVRLTNLGYEDADRQLFLADAQGKQNAMEAKRKAAQLKGGKAQTAEIARLAAEAKRQRQALLRQLKSLEPVTKLQKWRRLGIIDDAYFEGRMKLYGYSPGEIAAFKAESVPQALKNGAGAPSEGTGTAGGP